MIEKEQIHKLCETLAQNSSSLPTINERTAYNQALDDVWKNVQNTKEKKENNYYIVASNICNDNEIVNVTLNKDEAQSSFNEKVQKLKEMEEFKQADEYDITDNDEFFCFSDKHCSYYEISLKKFFK